jgi:hypothetical protein
VLEEGKEEVVGGVVEEDGEVIGGGDPIVEGGDFIVIFGGTFGRSEGRGTTLITSLALATTSRIVEGPVFGGGGDIVVAMRILVALVAGVVTTFGIVTPSVFEGMC